MHEARIADMHALSDALNDSKHLDGAVSFRAGDRVSGSVLQVNVDTVYYMLSETGRILFIPLSSISRFEYTKIHRGQGALEGYGIAFGISLPFALQDLEKSGGGSLFLTGVIVGPIGAIVGAIHGQREIFKYQIEDLEKTEFKK